MRSAAAQTIHEYDMRPVTSDIYVCDVLDRNGFMIKALREWEKRRGIVHSFKGRFIAPKPKPTPPEKKAKATSTSNRSVVVPREKPGRKPKYTQEEKRRLKNERNKAYRKANNAQSRKKAAQWREKRTPEQIEKCRQQVREFRARQRAAKQQGSVQAAGLPLPDAAVS